MTSYRIENRRSGVKRFMYDKKRAGMLGECQILARRERKGACEPPSLAFLFDKGQDDVSHKNETIPDDDEDSCRVHRWHSWWCVAIRVRVLRVWYTTCYGYRSIDHLAQKTHFQGKA
jgi:hypothetical protein